MSTAQQQERQGGSRWRAAFAAVRDVGTTMLALWGVWHQEHTGHVNGLLLLTYVVILGLIPASHAISLLRSPSFPSQESTHAGVPLSQ